MDKCQSPAHECAGTMQIHPNFKNLATVAVGAFFLYLVYILWGSGQPKLPEIWVDLRELINYSVLAAERGGHAVQLVHREKTLQVKTKSQTKEGSDEFVTKADLVSNQLILDTLERFPGVKIVSEEKSRIPLSDLDHYKLNNYELWQESQELLRDIPTERLPLSELGVWVDPLDATQEFTEDLLDFVTVMVCIVVSGRPKFGVIHRPFQGQTVWGLVGSGVHPNGSAATGTASKTIVVSRSHPGPVEALARKAFGENYPVESAGGSGYKVLRVLNGTAAIYMHKTAIKKWDLCAGDAIIRAAGGRMLTLDGGELSYFALDPQIRNDKGLLVALSHPFTYLARIKKTLSSDPP